MQETYAYSKAKVRKTRLFAAMQAIPGVLAIALIVGLGTENVVAVRIANSMREDWNLWMSAVLIAALLGTYFSANSLNLTERTPCQSKTI